MPKYSKHVDRLAQFIFSYIDRYDCGYLISSGDIPKMNPHRHYIFPNSFGNWKKQITRTHLTKHVARDEVYFYCTARKSEVILACIDYDAHDGQTDAPNAAKFIADIFFSRSYSEKSTNGAGIHQYILIRIDKYMRRDQANQNLKAVADQLTYICEDEGYESNICGIYGTYSILKKDEDGNVLDVERGDQAKIPRPETEEDLERLLNIEEIDLSDLQELVNAEYENRKKEEAKKLEKESNSSISPNVEILSQNKEMHYRANSLVPQDQNRLSPASKKPWIRTLWAISDYHQQNGKIPDVEEALQHYEIHCTVKPRHNRRVNRTRKQLRYYETTLDPEKLSEIPIGRYLKMAHDLIPEAHLAFDDNRNLSYEDVDAFITICTHIAFERSTDKRSHRASRSRIQQWFRNLKTSERHNRLCNNVKYQRLVEITDRYDLVYIWDVHVAPATEDGKTYRGWGRLLGPGRNHPRYADFCTYVEQLGLVIFQKSFMKKVG